MSVSIRISSLHTGSAGACLSAAESHGKRLDASSKARRVRDRSPLVYGSLELRSAYDAHVRGCRMNKSLNKPIQHAVLHFPTSFELRDEVTEQKLLDWAVQFINDTHGGDAVFAARLDRDEEGRHNVDVFFTPRYTKVTKSRGEERWISPTKFGKELCHKHRDELVRRHPSGKFSTGPRQVGIALNSELRARMALDPDFRPHLRQKREKEDLGADWVTPEAYKLEQREKELHRMTKRAEAAERSTGAAAKLMTRLGQELESMFDLLPDKVRRILERAAQVNAQYEQKNGMAKPSPSRPTVDQDDQPDSSPPPFSR